MSNYTPLFYAGVITHPHPIHNAGLAVGKWCLRLPAKLHSGLIMWKEIMMSRHGNVLHIIFVGGIHVSHMTHNVELWCFCFDRLHMLLNKQPISQWFEMPWLLCDITVKERCDFIPSILSLLGTKQFYPFCLMFIYWHWNNDVIAQCQWSKPDDYG